MCIFGSPKTPDISPPPAAAPAPTITPSEVSSQSSEEARRKRLQQLRSGLASTVKTSARGIVGSGPELQQSGAGKTKLGA